MQGITLKSAPALVELEGQRLPGHVALAKMYGSKDAAVRKEAIRLLNAYGQKATDAVLGYEAPEAVSLSDANNFPTSVPTNVRTRQTADRLRVDNMWPALFDVRDYRGIATDRFELTDVYDAVSIEEIPQGGKVRLRAVRGAQTTFDFARYAGGFQFDVFWERDNQLWKLANGLAAMQPRYANKQAQVAYTTLLASGFTDQPRSATGGASETQLDIETINAAADAILSGIYSATDANGDPIEEDLGTDPGFYLLYNQGTAGYSQRVAKILAFNFGMPNSNASTAQLAYAIQPLASRYVPTGKFYLVLPGRLNVAAIRQDLELFENFDPYTMHEDHMGWGRYRFVRGDAKQVRGIPLS